MNSVGGGLWIVVGLGAVMGLVMALPFLSKRVEEELEAFLLIMGVVSVSLAGLWSRSLVADALRAPWAITAAVLAAGLLFRAARGRVDGAVTRFTSRFGIPPFVFLLVAGLGLLSSLITAIIAALVLVEAVSALKLSRRYEVRLVILACYAIGLGAALTPIGEPLATIAVAKLRGEPHHADFLFLARLLGVWIVPIVLGLAAWAAGMRLESNRREPGLKENRPESLRDVVLRAAKVYAFVVGLVLLGAGFAPLADRYLLHLPGPALYWINLISAALDNATLAAVEISPLMPLATIRLLLLGLLVSGGILIPGNIPNIICANKLSIRSREWAAFGAPLGLALMAGLFFIHLVLGYLS
ncbi:MAG: DUF1646 family protein [bacterium]